VLRYEGCNKTQKFHEISRIVAIIFAEAEIFSIFREKKKTRAVKPAPKILLENNKNFANISYLPSSCTYSFANFFLNRIFHKFFCLFYCFYVIIFDKSNFSRYKPDENS
jgi:hypothetical protein